ncbi:MAG: hypothetical protein MI863_07150 [Desulfobacterales bacterium]|nr:hypothetical protein [Desulfobacterales bacterium]
MEDISRELEREIARAKPSPHRTSRKKKILVVDDFGELKSGGYLKVLVYLFSITSVIGIAGALCFYFLYTSASNENSLLKEKLAGVEKKADRLTNDKEILMARLVMTGKKPALDVEKTSPAAAKTQAKEKKPGIMPKPDFKNGSLKTVEEAKATPREKPLDAAPVLPQKTDETAELTATQAVEEVPVTPELEPFVAVEKFSVTQGSTNGELIVRFDIRNISTKPGGISGRIFTVLKPGTDEEEKWVVVPSAPLEDGMPSLYRKGQYFSISRFKPVKFTVRSQATPESFHKATVYIFNDDGKLMFNGNMKINEAETD